jgi:hypothetical protein
MKCVVCNKEIIIKAEHEGKISNIHEVCYECYSNLRWKRDYYKEVIKIIKELRVCN